MKDLVEKDLKINVGNMCTFLPQEKVGEFSGFDDKTGMRTVKLSAQVTGAFNSLPNASALIEVNCKKLVRAGEKLGVGDALAHRVHRT